MIACIVSFINKLEERRFNYEINMRLSCEIICDLPFSWHI